MASPSQLLRCTCTRELRRLATTSPTRRKSFRSFSSGSTSLQSQSQASNQPAYTPPLAPGILPAYDEALALLSRDRQEKLEKLGAKRGELDKVKGQGNKAQLRQLEEELEDLEIFSEINVPEVRWRFRNGLADLSKPVFRYLTEQEWRRGGAFDVLMQRITQMNVIPDLLPSIEPVADLRVRLGGADIVPGVFLEPQQTLEAPEIVAQVFHEDERLYTLMLVDPDVPDDRIQGYTTYCHWMVTNIPLSATKTSILPSSDSSTVVLPYIPPHPQQGTKYHRYSFLLFAQSQAQTVSDDLNPSKDELPVTRRIEVDVADVERAGFKPRDWVRSENLHGVGCHFYREVWSETVSEIYKNILNEREPKYGPSPRLDPYRIRGLKA